MSTRNIVPRNDGEGNLGTSLKNWLKGWFKTLFVSGNITDGTDNITVADARSTIDDQSLLREENDFINSTGLVDGGVITPTGGIGFSISDGIGYIHTATINKKVTWTGITGSTLFNGANFINIDENGSLIITQTRPSTNLIKLGIIVTGSSNTEILGISTHPEIITNFNNFMYDHIRDNIPTLVSSGLKITEQDSPNELKLNMNEGSAYIRLDKLSFSETTTLTKLYIYTVSSGQVDAVIDTNDLNKVNTTHWNNIAESDPNLALVEMTPGYWKKDTIALSPQGLLLYIYSTEEFPTRAEALEAPVGFVRNDIRREGIILATIISQKGDTSVKESIRDNRPFFDKVFGFLGGTDLGEHDQLGGLLDNDHPQYMLRSEFDSDNDLIVDKSEALNDGSTGGGNNVSASEARNHIDDTNNPHAVTKAQVGLPDVPNLDTTDAVNNEHTHPNKTELDLITDGDHDVRTDNPHQTTISNLDSKNHSELDNKNAEVDIKHVTDNQKDALDNANTPSSTNPLITQDDYDPDKDGIVDKAESLNDGSTGGGNNVTALEARNHIDDTNNPHSTSLSNLITKDHSELTNKNAEVDIKHVTDNQKNALDNANSPSASNPIITQDDYDGDGDGIVDQAENLNDGTTGGGNNVSALEVRNHLDNPNAHDANEIDTDTTNFDGALSGSDTEVQQALDTLDNAVGALQTQEKSAFFKPTRATSTGDYNVLNIGQNGTTKMTFDVPSDFNSLVALEFLFDPVSTIGAGQTCDLESDYASVGETLQNHSESSLGQSITGTANTLTVLDISTVFTAITAGDVCGFSITLNGIGTAINILGIRIRYV